MYFYLCAYVNNFSFHCRADSDTDYDELSDGEINKLLIVTQTPVRPKKHGKCTFHFFCSIVIFRLQCLDCAREILKMFFMIIHF